MHEEEESNALVESRMSFVPEWIPYLTIQYSMPTTAKSCSCSYPSFPVSYLSYHPSPKFSICMYSVIYLPSLPPSPSTNPIQSNHQPPKKKSITTPIPPPGPPPLLPPLTIKFLFPQFPIYRIMRLTHPLPKFLSTADSRCIRRIIFAHPRSKIFGADSARIQFSEEMEKLSRFGLLRRSWVGRVVGRERVEECPG